MPDQRLTVGVARERDDRERRVALIPDGVVRLIAAGLHVVVETGAGEDAGFPDAAYAGAGAALAKAGKLSADVTVCVGAPDPATVRRGSTLLGLLQPFTELDRVAAYAAAGATAISLDCLPRTLSRAQSMDALTSQANLAGYKAVLVAADTYDGFFPMLMTAAGTTRPASVLVLGAGVAGLQALATARRLGAVTTGYDVREAARGDVLSTGAAFLDLGPVAGTGEGGYARELSPEERQAQQDALVAAVSKFDVVITTAQVPGRRPPVLLPAAALAALKSGSVVVDLAAGPLGGNVDGSVPDATITTPGGVTVIGAGNLPSAMPRTASTAYSRNITNLLAHLVRDGQLVLDLEDEITGGVVVTHNGEVVHPGVAQVLADRIAVPA
jgi:NAD(P) transhydrogenase subunit alpha